MAHYGDWQLSVYLGGLTGQRPSLPVSYAELERRAGAEMSEELWSYVAGGAGDELTQDRNARAFDGWGLVQRVLVGAAERDLSVSLLGREHPSPLLLAPVGVVGLVTEDRHGDLATARASAASGVPMVASTLSQDPLEDVAAALGDGTGWFQLYPPSDWELTESLVQRAERAGFEAVVVTLDTLTLGWRPRDLAIASFPQLQGLCLANYFSDPVFRSRLAAPPEDDPQAATGMWAAVFGNPRLSWDDLDRLRTMTSLPVLLKGVCDADDAARAVDAGVDGVWVSTHGGRQANGGVPALDYLPEVREAVGDRVPVVFDSGVRSGVDVLKAVALGADAVAVGRPYAYGAALAGQEGVEHVLRCLLAEADLTMAIQGYPTLAALRQPGALRRVTTP